MRFLLATLAAVAIAIPSPGCRKSEPETTVAEPATPARPASKQQPAQGAIGRLKEKTAVENDLRQIATWYQQEALDNLQGKGLAKLDGLLQTIKQQQRGIYEAIENGDYVIVKNAPGNGIVAYEKQADQNDRHFAAFGDLRVDYLSTQELEKKLKEQKAN